MSVLVTTSFSQGAVFYAGETLSCTITFTNTVPSPQKSPSNSSSLTRPRSPRLSGLSVSSGGAMNGASGSKHTRSSSHSRSPSNSSLHTVHEQQTLQPPPPQQGTSSLASLASSTLAYFTGYGQSQPQEPSPPAPAPAPPSQLPPTNNGTTSRLAFPDAHKDLASPNVDQQIESNGSENHDSPHLENGVDWNEIELGEEAGNGAIPIELDSHVSPRMSFESSAAIGPGGGISSRRSSMDSTASAPYYRQQLVQTSLHLQQQQMQQMQQMQHIQQHPPHPSLPHAPPAGAPRRLSRLLKSPSTPSLMKKPEHLLWGFAQVVGQFVADPTLINTTEFAPLKHRTMYRPQGAGFGGGGGMIMAKNNSNSNNDTRTTPVFSTPPSILFVDLDLAPGESKKYTYKLKLPNDLPPTHRGKAIRFQYYLVVGTQRAPPTTNGVAAPPQRPSSQGHVVQLRFRVLNHVTEDGSRPIYDLMNPVVMVKDMAKVDEIPFDRPRRRDSNSSVQIQQKQDQPRTVATNDVSERDQFMQYVNDLLEKSQKNQDVQEITRRESNAYDEQPMLYDEDHDDAMTEQAFRKTCAQIVSRIVHTSRKAMYDLCKSNQRVAKLQLTKVAHRLGEPIQGVLDFGEATLATYRVSITLESHEIVESSIAVRAQSYINRVTRRGHSDFHAFCLANRRLAFSLPIPATASPDFQTTGVKLQYYLKFEFITSSHGNNDTTSPAFVSIQRDDRHQHYQSQEHIAVSTFDCQIPVKVYGSPNGADRTIYGQPHTFPVS